jgi:acetylornithine deacetylase
MTAPDATALLARLVAHPSTAGTSNGELIADIATLLEAADARVEVHEGTRAGAQVLHAVLGPADASDGVLLAAHSDVVDVEGQPWTADPFTLRAEEGRLYGRGAADMKGFIAATLAAIEQADASSLRAPVHVAISHDEELGCAGTAPLLDALGGITAPLAGVVVGEPTELRVVDRHKGKAALAVTLRGRAAHSATPDKGVNAVRGAAKLIHALEALERQLASEVTDPAFSVPHATIGIGPIAGGVAVNIVPDRCTLKVETRVLPGQRVEAVVNRIRDVAARIGAEMAAGADEAGVDVDQVAGYPPLTPTPQAAAFASTIAAIAGRGTSWAVDFGTEAGLYQERLGVPVIVCGPGSMSQGHTPDEFLEADQLVAGQAFVAGIIERLR